MKMSDSHHHSPNCYSLSKVQRCPLSPPMRCDFWEETTDPWTGPGSMSYSASTLLPEGTQVFQNSLLSGAVINTITFNQILHTLKALTVFHTIIAAMSVDVTKSELFLERSCLES